VPLASQSFVMKFYDFRVICMYHALIQRMSITMCQPFIRTLDFSCQAYPQCVLELHESIVLPCTLVLLALWAGKIEYNSQHLLIGH
jgi:hypothetical protein